jgi:beta-N-acetylhexosaminidase
VLFGCAGQRLTSDERAFFRQADPWGFILFARNCADPQQVRALNDSLREITGRDDTPILIDQEGGRVQRLKPPHWRSRVAAKRFGDLYRHDREHALRLTRLNAQAMAAELRDVGVTVDCAPVLDVPALCGHGIIGDRAFGDDVATIAALGEAQMQGLLDGGVLPVIKHLPGHGRAKSDSHLELPVVDTPAAILEATDFATFRMLAHAPLAMTAHVVFTAFDAERPATISSRVISDVIRGRIGFDGCLMSDDLSMKALKGDFRTRARESLEAGCDIVLHCNGEKAEMTAIAEATPLLSGDPLRRAQRALGFLKSPKPFDVLAAENELQSAFAEVA